MKFLWSLATKNLFRNKLRTTISIIAIAFSVMLVVFLRGLIVGMVDSMFEMHIKYKAGHIRVIKDEYQQKERLLSLNYPVNGWQGEGLAEMKQELEEINGVEEVVPRLKFGAAVSTKDDLVSMMGWGVDPKIEKDFTNIEEFIVEGRMVEMGQKELVMGSNLLEKVKSEVGDKLTLVYTTSWGSFKGSTFKIVGEINSGFKLLDDNVFYLALDQAQMILEMPGMATELLLITPDYNQVGGVIPVVESFFADKDPDNSYFVTPWNKGDTMIELMQVSKKIYNGIYIFVVLLASIVVINTMVMIVKERTKEIGMLTALGFKRKEVLISFVMEGFVMGLFGSLVGVIAGGVITKIISIVGIDYSAALADMDAEIMIRPIIYPVVNYYNLIYSFILGVVITTLTAIIPARKAANLDPTEALRSE